MPVVVLLLTLAGLMLLWCVSVKRSHKIGLIILFFSVWHLLNALQNPSVESSLIDYTEQSVVRKVF